MPASQIRRQPASGPKETGFEVLGRPACRQSSEEGGTRKTALTHDEPLSPPLAYDKAIGIG